MSDELAGLGVCSSDALATVWWKRSGRAARLASREPQLVTGKLLRGQGAGWMRAIHVAHAFVEEEARQRLGSIHRKLGKRCWDEGSAGEVGAEVW